MPSGLYFSTSAAGVGGHHGDLAATLGQHAQDVALHAEVVSDHVELGVSTLPKPGLPPSCGLDNFHSVSVRQPLRCGSRPGPDLGQPCWAQPWPWHGVSDDSVSDLLAHGQRHDGNRFERPSCAARVSLRVSMLAMPTVPSAQVLRERLVLAEVGSADGQILDDQTSGMDFRGFDVFTVDTVVTDVRIRQGDDLLQ